MVGATAPYSKKNNQTLIIAIAYYCLLIYYWLLLYNLWVYMSTNKRTARLALTLSPQIDSVVTRYAIITGQKKTAVINNLLVMSLPFLTSALGVLESGDTPTNATLFVLENV